MISYRVKGPGLVVIQGVRRCGKSTFAVNCFDEEFVYINFDDERLQDLQAKDLNNLLVVSYELYGVWASKLQATALS